MKKSVVILFVLLSSTLCASENLSFSVKTGACYYSDAIWGASVGVNEDLFNSNRIYLRIDSSFGLLYERTGLRYESDSGIVGGTSEYGKYNSYGVHLSGSVYAMLNLFKSIDLGLGVGGICGFAIPNDYEFYVGDYHYYVPEIGIPSISKSVNFWPFIKGIVKYELPKEYFLELEVSSYFFSGAGLFIGRKL